MTFPEVDSLLRGDPRVIGSHRILGRLGAGGMATVYLGTSASSGLESLVAVKLIHQHLAEDEQFRARFAREVELAARVPAFCAAEVRGHGVHDDRPYLVTEFVPGTPLHKLVESEGPLDPATVHSIAVGLAAGLTAIHDCELVHRDLKPSNVIVTRGGVRIIDFGIARSVDVISDFTTTGVVMGSLGWTSPEQLDAQDPTPAMDVFAWGCLIAYASTGRHPFGGGDAASRCWRILHVEPELDGLPPLLGELVRAALDRETERRPTAQELLLGLVGAAGPVLPVRAAPPGRPSESHPDADSAAPEGRWWARGNRRRRAVALTVAPLGLVLAAVLAWAGNPLHLGDEPASGGGSRGGVSTPSGPADGRPVGPGGGTAPMPPTAAGGRGAASDTGPVLGPGEQAPGAPGEPTATPAPTGTDPGQDPGDPGNGDPGNGNPGNGSPGNGNPGNGKPGNGNPGNGNTPTKSKQPRG